MRFTHALTVTRHWSGQPTITREKPDRGSLAECRARLFASVEANQMMPRRTVIDHGVDHAVVIIDPGPDDDSPVGIIVYNVVTLERQSGKEQ